MNHENYREPLSALLDGELSKAERADVLAHLETCETCRAYFAELNALRCAFGELEEIDAPDGFAEGVLARLHEEAAEGVWTAGEPKRRVVWRRRAGFAACAAVVLLAGSVWRFAHMGMGGAAPAGGSEGAYLVTESAPAAAEPGNAGVSVTEYAAQDAPAPAKAPTNGSSENERFAAPDAEEPAALMPAGAEDGGSAAEETREAGDEDVPVLYLSGEGAAAWLAENGEPLGGGRWRVTAEAANALPDTLALTAAGEVQRPDGGALIVTLAETEAAP